MLHNAVASAAEIALCAWALRRKHVRKQRTVHEGSAKQGGLGAIRRKHEDVVSSPKGEYM